MRPAVAHAQREGKQQKTGVVKDYRSRGYDYGRNFTLNICEAVVDPVTDVVGVPKSSWRNVSAYYMAHGDIYSIGFVPAPFLCPFFHAPGQHLFSLVGFGLSAD